MEKPTTMPLKEWFIKRLALKLMIPEFVIKEVINFQATEAVKATANNNSVELSGFGKFIFYERKALKKMEKYEACYSAYMKELGEDIAPEVRVRLEKKLASVIRDIGYLNIKLKGNGD